MGCKSGKASPPLLAASPSAEHTLLAAGNHHLENYALKAGADTSVDAPALGKSSSESFDGRWSGGVISGTTVTWEHGKVSQVRLDRSSKTLKVCLEGNDLVGELHDDNQIHWNNGEVWTRRYVCAGFCEHNGFIEGPDLAVRTMTLEEAKYKASSMPSCVGFTTDIVSNDCSADTPVRVHFKSNWNIGCTVGQCKSYKKVEVICEVGDSVMAVFTPNDRRYPAHISSINPDNTITVNWIDGGKTHRKLPASKVFKDGVAPPRSHAQGSDQEQSRADATFVNDCCGCIASNNQVEQTAPAGLPEDAEWPRFLEKERTNSEDGKEDKSGCERKCEDVIDCSLGCGRTSAANQTEQPRGFTTLLECQTQHRSNDALKLPEMTPSSVQRHARKERMCCC